MDRALLIFVCAIKVPQPNFATVNSGQSFCYRLFQSLVPKFRVLHLCISGFVGCLLSHVTYFRAICFFCNTLSPNTLSSNLSENLKNTIYVTLNRQGFVNEHSGLMVFPRVIFEVPT